MFHVVAVRWQLEIKWSKGSTGLDFYNVSLTRLALDSGCCCCCWQFSWGCCLEELHVAFPCGLDFSLHDIWVSKRVHFKSQHSKTPRWKLQGFLWPILGNCTLSLSPYMTGYRVRPDSKGKDYNETWIQSWYWGWLGGPFWRPVTIGPFICLRIVSAPS